MVHIPVTVCGDDWINPDQTISMILENRHANNLVLTLNTEGPSLRALGIIDRVQQTLDQVNYPVDRVWVDRWHNAVEDVPFRRVFSPILSHFFWTSDRYRHRQPDPSEISHAMALFVGRATIPRASIMYDLYHNMREHVFMSLMKGHGASSHLKSNLDDWVDIEQQQSIREWFHDPPVKSITGHCVRDQYTGEQNTNAALITHYNKFAIEIVCETYCLGETFYPTEKTVRPISQGKPMLVYGPSRFLERLRQLGFETWQEVWDESYDILSGPDRWQKIKNSMQDILRDRSWLDPRTKIIGRHNLAVLQHLIKKHGPG